MCRMFLITVRKIIGETRHFQVDSLYIIGILHKSLNLFRTMLPKTTHNNNIYLLSYF